MYYSVYFKKPLLSHASRHTRRSPSVRSVRGNTNTDGYNKTGTNIRSIVSSYGGEGTLVGWARAFIHARCPFLAAPLQHRVTSQSLYTVADAGVQ